MQNPDIDWFKRMLDGYFVGKVPQDRRRATTRPAHTPEVERRRAKNKVARKSRIANRRKK